jgi:hypothetical protein
MRFVPSKKTALWDIVKLMAECVSKRCKQKIEEGWSFCAFCGSDNRPETFRPGILACPHLFFQTEGFCIRCGECRDGRPTAAQRAVQASIGRTLLFFGILVAGLSFAAYQIHLNHWPGNEFIMPWYDETYSLDGKSVQKGDDYVSWGETAGAILSGLGVLASVVARVNAGRRRKG